MYNVNINKNTPSKRGYIKIDKLSNTNFWTHILVLGLKYDFKVIKSK